MKIKRIKARQILDSRGNPTVEAEVWVEIDQKLKHKNQNYEVSSELFTENTVIGIASVPSGASTGEHEAMELRDGEMVHFWGKGVLKAVENVEKIIAPLLMGMDVVEQRKIDEAMINLDGTENKSKLGANAILAVSLACARVAAKIEGVWLFEYLSKFRISNLSKQTYFELQEEKNLVRAENYVLPVPFMNVINGGKHAPDGGDFQEYMLVPHGFDSFAEALESADEVFMKLKEILHNGGYGTLVGDEGGFAPRFKRAETVLNFLMKAIKEAGFDVEKQISIAMDPAASEFYFQNQKKYVLKKEKLKLTREEMMKFWIELMKKYPIVSLEDPLDENDWEGWKLLNSKLKTQNLNFELVGDDLLVTNLKRLQKAIGEKSCNAILIKLNQIGTLTETIDVINLAHKNGFNCMVSHRSGETSDTFIADLAVGMGTGQIKAGSLSRSDRVAKYNRLLKIEKKLGRRGNFGKLGE